MIHHHASKRIRLAFVGLGVLLTACALPPDEYLVPITTESDDARELYIRGREQIENVRVAEGRALLEQAIDRDAEFALAHLALAETAATTNTLFDHLDRAVARSGSVSEGERLMILGAEAGAKGDVAAQLEHYSRLLEAFPEDERVQTLVGRFHFCQREYEEAAARSRSGIHLNPELAPAYNLLGYSNRRLGRDELAERAFKKYVQLLPLEPNAHDSYAEMRMKQGRFDEAIASYERALELDPAFAASLVGIGNVRMFQGRFDEARDRFRQVLERATDDGQRRQGLLWIAASYLHQGNPERALDGLRGRSALVEASGDLAAVASDLNLIGDVLYETGRLDEAATHYDRAAEVMEQADVPDELKREAERDRTYRSLRLAVARGNIDEASQRLLSYRRSLSGTKDRTGYRRYQEVAGLVALTRKDYDRAVRAFSYADRQSPRILYLAAMAHRGAGNLEQARRIGDQAARFNALSFDYAYVKRKAEKFLSEL